MLTIEKNQKIEKRSHVVLEKIAAAKKGKHLKRGQI
jgi:hypothetical protein